MTLSRWTPVEGGFTSPCHKWLGPISSGGYGRVYFNGMARQAHRVIYEQRHGPVPAPLEMDHLCRNRWCVNPDHLEPVTKKENQRRGASSPLTTAKVASIKARLASGTSQSQLAREHGVSLSTVHDIRHGRLWADVLPEGESEAA